MTEEVTPKVIYLLPNEGFDGEAVWCDHNATEAPDAVKYIRSDIADKLAEALKFYSDKSNYTDHTRYYDTLISDDNGDRATEALTEYEASK